MNEEKLGSHSSHSLSSYRFSNDKVATLSDCKVTEYETLSPANERPNMLGISEVRHTCDNRMAHFTSHK